MLEGFNRVEIDESNLRGSIPNVPGVYIFESNGQVLYVGKSVRLRDRILQHVASKADFLSSSTHIRYVVTSSEDEALKLEYSLISYHLPPYNLQFRIMGGYRFLGFKRSPDGYPYPVVVRLKNVRDIEQLGLDPSTLVGPLPELKGSTSAKKLIRLLGELYGVRQCRLNLKRRKPKACVYQELGLCSAPCLGRISKEEYMEKVQAAVRALKEGFPDSLMDELRSEMYRKAEELKFEEAAVLRDRIALMTELNSKVKWESYKSDRTSFLISLIRRGSSLSIVVSRYWRGAVDILGTITLKGELKEVLPSLLGSLRLGTGVEVVTDSQEIYDILERFVDNVPLKLYPRDTSDPSLRAAFELISYNLHASRRDKLYEVLEVLRRRLGLMSLERIEAYDVSHIAGKHSYAAMVVWNAEVMGFQKGAYRLFSVDQGADDVASISEVAYRRFKRLGGSDLSDLPDLILLDGGAGQLKGFRDGALRALSEANLSMKLQDLLKVTALSKPNKRLLHMDLYSGEVKELSLPSATVNFLYTLTTEAHRFSNKARRRAMRRSLNLG